MNKKENILDKFEFSNHICIKRTKNVVEMLEVILNERVTPVGVLSDTFKSSFNDIEISLEQNGDIIISGLKNKSDLKEPFLELDEKNKDLNMDIFQNLKYDFLVEYTTENKQLFHHMTLEELFQTDNAKNILTIYDVGIVGDLTLLAWRV